MFSWSSWYKLQCSRVDPLFVSMLQLPKVEVNSAGDSIGTVFDDSDAHKPPYMLRK